MHSVASGRLSNGVRVVTIHRPHLHRTVVSAYIEVGSRHETPRTNGLSHFLEHMLFRGTRRYPTAYALNHAIESLGGTLSAATHGDYTLFDMAVPPTAVEGACGLLGSIFTQPVFSQIDTEKGIVREEILEDLDDDHRDINADNLARRQVFGAHPLGYPITGTLANVERFTERDLRRHLDRYYRGGNMVVSVCSPLPHRHVARAIEKGFADVPPGPRDGPRVARVSQRRARLQRVARAGSQTCVRVAFPTPGEATTMARAVEVLMRVLDDGMSTRLHRRICDELGLAYEVSAGVELFQDVGIMDVASSVAHGSVPRLITEVLSMLGDLALEGPSRAELEKVQNRYAFDLAALDDDPHGLADYYGAASLWNNRMDIEARRREVLALTTDDLRRAARVVFSPMRLNLTTVGTVDDASRRELSEIVRRFRERVGRRARIVVPRPPVKVREPIAVRFGRSQAALDSACSPF
jgi:predicted Zn-dependent peptidase